MGEVLNTSFSISTQGEVIKVVNDVGQRRVKSAHILLASTKDRD